VCDDNAAYDQETKRCLETLKHTACDDQDGTFDDDWNICVLKEKTGSALFLNHGGILYTQS